MEDAVTSIDQNSASKPSYRQLAPIVIALVVGVSVSIAAFLLVVHQEKSEVRHRFEHQAEAHSDILNNALINAEDELDSVAEFFAASGEVTEAAFHTFATAILRRHPELRALTWFPRVADADRSAFEQRVRNERKIDFRIRDVTSEGELVLAAKSDEYFPALASVPADRPGIERTWGFNPISNETRRAAFFAARDTGKRTASQRIKLLSIVGGPFAVAIIQPIYRNDAEVDTIMQRRAALTGYVTIVFQVAGLVETRFRSYPLSGMDFYLYDQAADGSTDLLYYHSSRTRAEGVEPESESLLRTGLHSVYQLDVAGRSWLAIFRPAPGYFNPETWHAWTLLVAGLLLTGILTLYQRSILLQNLRISHLVKQRTSALERTEGQLRLVTDALPVLIAYFDTDQRCRYANKTFLAWYKGARDETVGESLKKIVGKETYETIEPRIERALEGEPQFFEFEASHADGKTRELEVSYVPHLGSDGKVLGAFVLAIDVTDRNAAQEQLLQAQKMEAVGKLTGGVAHEFNNLLMVIFGNIEALESRLEDNDPLQSFISSAMKGARRGAELTQSLLAFSRKQRLETGETDLNGLVLGMQSLFQRTLGKNILIKTDLAGGLWRTSADAGQIEAALLNFVFNARDAMPNGGTITVGTSNRVMTTDTAAHYDCVEPGEYVTLKVSDTGTGMTEEQIRHAFEPFYTTKEVGKGTGLGLSVAFGFAKQSGGCLEIQSKPGQGTVVSLSLPRCSESEFATEKEERLPAEPITGTGKILVVEDDAEVRDLVVSQLVALGYEIIQAEDAPTALKLLNDHPDIDLLFSDVVLPGGMTGTAVAGEARSANPDLKILFTSGYPEKDVEDLIVEGKEVTILRKPYRKTELAEAIAATMNSGQSKPLNSGESSLGVSNGHQERLARPQTLERLAPEGWIPFERRSKKRD